MNHRTTTNRFYPDFYPEFVYEPTKDKFRLIDADGKGQGIISLVEYQPNEIVFRFAGVLVNRMTLFTLQLDDEKHLHDPFFMGKILHSCDPNMSCDMVSQTFTCIKPIKPGDYLTMDYETTEDVLFRSFECGCGAHNCRKLIRGKKFRMPGKEKSFGSQVRLHTI